MKKTSLIYVTFISIAVYGIMILSSEKLIFPSVGIVIFLCVLTFFDYLLKSIRWKILLNHYGMKISFLESVKTYIAGLMFVITPGKVGSVVKAELMNKRHGFTHKKVGFVVVVERIFDIIAHIIIGGTMAFFVARQYLKSIWLIFGIILLGLMGLYFFRDKFKLIKKELEKLKDLKLIMITTCLSVVSWIIENFEVWLALLYFGEFITFPQAAFAFSASLVLGNLSMMPGGLGATEATSTGLLLLFAVNKEVATSVTMLTRLTTLWFGFIIGSITWFLTYKQLK